jgi:hypothetical protein
MGLGFTDGGDLAHGYYVSGDPYAVLLYRS